MSKTQVTLHINTTTVERLWRLAEAKGLTPDFLAGVAFSNLLDEFEVIDAAPSRRATELSPVAQVMTGCTKRSTS